MWFNEYPYININDLNLDYLLRAVKALRYDLENFVNLNTIKYADPIQWNITRQYEANTVVIDANDGTAYLSTNPVPSGVALTNTDYWTPIFTLNLLSTNQNITLRDDGANVLATFASAVDDWLIWNNTLYKVTRPIALNEAYVVGYNLERYSVELFLKDAITSIEQLLTNAIDDVNTTIGDLDNLNTTDKSSIVNAINSIFSSTNYVTPEMFGAVGDGVTDDTEAFRDIIGLHATVLLADGKSYYCEFDVANKLSYLGNGTIVYDPVVAQGTSLFKPYACKFNPTIKNPVYDSMVGFSECDNYVRYDFSRRGGWIWSAVDKICTNYARFNVWGMLCKNHDYVGTEPTSFKVYMYINRLLKFKDGKISDVVNSTYYDGTLDDYYVGGDSTHIEKHPTRHADCIEVNFTSTEINRYAYHFWTNRFTAEDCDYYIVESTITTDAPDGYLCVFLGSDASDVTNNVVQEIGGTTTKIINGSTTLYMCNAPSAEFLMDAYGLYKNIEIMNDYFTNLNESYLVFPSGNTPIEITIGEGFTIIGYLNSTSSSAVLRAWLVADTADTRQNCVVTELTGGGDPVTTCVASGHNTVTFTPSTSYGKYFVYRPKAVRKQ